jgi:hypothetical protein
MSNDPSRPEQSPSAATPAVEPILPVSLPPQQETALELLRNGASLSDAARDAGVDRRTLYRWLHSNPVFRAAYNQWQNEVYEYGRAKMISLIGVAAAAVENDLKNGNGKLGLQLLDKMNVFKKRKRCPSDPNDIRRLTDIRDFTRRSKLDQAEREAELQDKRRRKDDQEYDKGLAKLVKSKVQQGPEGEWHRLPRDAKPPDPLPKTSSLIETLRKADPEKWGK